MITAIIFLVVGTVLILLLTNIKLEKKVLSQIGIIIGVLCLLYGLILFLQPDDFIKFTKTTVSKEADLSKTK
jgi:intracellular septation protein A